MVPVLKPFIQVDGKFRGAFRKKSPRDLDAISLQLGFAVFNEIKQLVVLFSPMGFAAFESQSIGQKDQIVNASKKVAQLRQFFDHSADNEIIPRPKESHLVAEQFRLFA